MTKPPKHIWLQASESDAFGPTWCDEKIHDDDVKYVRDDVVLSSSCDSTKYKLVPVEPSNNEWEIVAFNLSSDFGPDLVKYMEKYSKAFWREMLRATITPTHDPHEEPGMDADAQMLLVKACEHIAEGDEGWEKLRNECPSTAAVSALRDKYQASHKALEAAREALQYADDHFCFTNCEKVTEALNQINQVLGDKEGK